MTMLLSSTFKCDINTLRTLPKCFVGIVLFDKTIFCWFYHCFVQLETNNGRKGFEEAAANEEWLPCAHHASYAECTTAGQATVWSSTTV